MNSKSTAEDQNLSDQNKSLVWLGLTDDNETKGIETSSGGGSTSIEINATEGNWTWMNGNLAQDGYLKLRKRSDTNTTRNFAAMEWNATNVTNFDGNDSNGTWIDVNGSLKLRYVIEFDLPETQSVQVSLKGFRKFLVVPARWMDEPRSLSVLTNKDSSGTNNPSSNELGEPINEDQRRSL